MDRKDFQEKTTTTRLDLKGLVEQMSEEIDEYRSILKQLKFRDEDVNFILANVEEQLRNSKEIGIDEILDPANIQADIDKIKDSNLVVGQRYFFHNGILYKEHHVPTYDDKNHPLGGHFIVEIGGKNQYVPKGIFTVALVGMLSTQLAIKFLNREENEELKEAFLKHNYGRIVAITVTLLAPFGLNKEVKEVDGVNKTTVMQNAGKTINALLLPFFEKFPFLTRGEENLKTHSDSLSIMFNVSMAYQVLIKIATQFLDKNIGSASHTAASKYIVISDGDVNSDKSLIKARGQIKNILHVNTEEQ